MVFCGKHGAEIENSGLCLCESGWDNAIEFSFVIPGNRSSVGEGSAQPCTVNKPLLLVVYLLLFVVSLIITITHAVLIRRWSQVKRNFAIMLGFFLGMLAALLRMIDLDGGFGESVGFSALALGMVWCLSSASALFVNKYIVYRSKLLAPLGSRDVLNFQVSRCCSRFGWLGNGKKMAESRMLQRSVILASSIQCGMLLAALAIMKRSDEDENNLKVQKIVKSSIIFHIYLALYSLVALHLLSFFINDLKRIEKQKFKRKRTELHWTRLKESRKRMENLRAFAGFVLGFMVLMVSIPLCSPERISIYAYTFPLYFSGGGLIAIAVMFTYTSNRKGPVKKSASAAQMSRQNKKTSNKLDVASSIQEVSCSDSNAILLSGTDSMSNSKMKISFADQ